MPDLSPMRAVPFLLFLRRWILSRNARSRAEDVQVHVECKRADIYAKIHVLKSTSSVRERTFMPKYTSYNSFLIFWSAPFSSLETCACDMPISSAISIWVFPL